MRAANLTPLLIVVSIAACNGAEKHAHEEQVARTAIAAESAKAAQAASIPYTGKWDEPHLVERMVRAGLAPQAMPDEKGEAYWKVPVLAYRVGPSLLYAYIYADSTARRAVTATLDTITASPRGSLGPYPPRHILIVQNNIAAVMVGGTDAQQERVSFAIRAGLPAAPKK